MKSKHIRADIEFENWIKRIQKERIKIGKDDLLRGNRRITRAIRRHPLSKEIELDIISSDLD